MQVESGLIKFDDNQKWNRFEIPCLAIFNSLFSVSQQHTNAESVASYPTATMSFTQAWKNDGLASTAIMRDPVRPNDSGTL